MSLARIRAALGLESNEFDPVQLPMNIMGWSNLLIPGADIDAKDLAFSFYTILKDAFWKARGIVMIVTPGPYIHAAPVGWKEVDEESLSILRNLNEFSEKLRDYMIKNRYQFEGFRITELDIYALNTHPVTYQHRLMNEYDLDDMTMLSVNWELIKKLNLPVKLDPNGDVHLCKQLILFNAQVLFEAERFTNKQIFKNNPPVEGFKVIPLPEQMTEEAHEKLLEEIAAWYNVPGVLNTNEMKIEIETIQRNEDQTLQMSLQG